MSTKNILTGVVVALALVLVVLVVLVKTGVINNSVQKTTQPETVIETSIIVVTGTDEHGDEFEYTMMSHYVKPKVSSKYTYAYRPKTTTSTTTEVPTYFVEETSMVPVTDESGVAVTNENGEFVTEVVTHTVLMTGTTTEPTTVTTTEYVPRTSSIEVTNRWGQVEKDGNGVPKTEVVTIDPPVPTEGDIWSESVVSATTASSILNNAGSPKRNEALATAIVEQLNRDRLASGLAPLAFNSELKSDAELNSISMASPDIYTTEPIDGAYTFVTDFGGNRLYTEAVAPEIALKASSPEMSQIGVGVLEYEGKYYTTVVIM